jgi:hypothetical protein
VTAADAFCTPVTWPLLAGLVGYSLLEYWLGKTPRTRAASLPELLVLVLMSIIGLITRRRREESPMAIETKQIEYAKETGDVMVAVIELVKDIKAGKSLAELGAENLTNLIAAVSGADQIPAEATHRAAILQTIGLHTGQLADALLPSAAAPAPIAGDVPAGSVG